MKTKILEYHNKRLPAPCKFIATVVAKNLVLIEDCSFMNYASVTNSVCEEFKEFVIDHFNLKKNIKFIFVGTDDVAYTYEDNLFNIL